MKEPIWLDERDVLALHDGLLASHGGAEGLRDVGLLKSPLARPQQHFASVDSPGIIDMAATYTIGIVRNHPFVDGNKRTGFVAGEENAARAVLELAAGNLDETGYTAFLRGNVAL